MVPKSPAEKIMAVRSRGNCFACFSHFNYWYLTHGFLLSDDSDRPLSDEIELAISIKTHQLGLPQ